MRHLKQEAFPTRAEIDSEIWASFELDELRVTRKKLFMAIMSERN